MIFLLALLIMEVLLVAFESLGIPVNVYTLWVASYIAWYYTGDSLMLLCSTFLMWASVLSLLIFIGAC